MEAIRSISLKIAKGQKASVPSDEVWKISMFPEYVGNMTIFSAGANNLTNWDNDMIANSSLLGGGTEISANKKSLVVSGVAFKL